jgi:aspartate aminotransferase-like enzyme
VTAVVVPTGVDEGALRKTMRAKYGFQIAGGQGELKGKIIRFSHMGYVDAFDTLGVLAALEMTLIGQGFKLAPGSGVAAAQKVFAEAMK